MSILSLVLAGGCTKPQPPPRTAAPALDTSSEREISYLIEREEQGHTAPAPEDFQFRSGDRFRFRFRPGFPAYMYVANRGSHQAAYRVLFPAGEERSRNPLKAGTPVALPIDAEWLRLDESPGNEYLVLIASTVRLSELEQTAEIPRDTFEAQLAGIERRYQPDSSRRFRDGDWTKFFAAREGDLALVVRLALEHR
jgi:hypothetical protein